MAFDEAGDSERRPSSGIPALYPLIMDKRLSVAVNCCGLKKGAGGISVYCRDIVSALVEPASACDVILYHGKDNQDELDRLMPTIWPGRSRLVDDWRQLTGDIQTHHLYFAPLNGYYPLPVPVPTVVTLHDNQERFYPDLFEDQQIRRRRLLQRGAAFCGDIVIAISKFAADCLQVGYGLRPEKIRVCPHFAHPLSKAKKPEPPLPPAFLFYPANRWRHKNHERLVEAVALLRRNYRLDVPVVCSGARLRGGVDLERLARQFGVPDLIHDLGFIEESQVAWLYKNAAALVFPSLYEGFGYPLLEAMSVGCPVVAAKAGALPEVADAAAMYFSPANAEEMAAVIRNVWENPGLRNKLAEKGRTRVKAFSQERFLQTHLSSFRDAIKLYETPRCRKRNVRRYFIQKQIWRLRELFQGVRFEPVACLPPVSQPASCA